MIGRTISHYELLERLGGGDGEAAWKARDVRRGRLALLRLVPRRNGSRDPFASGEIELAAALDHPNICAVEDAGNDGGHAFLAMAWAEGETLADRLQRGPLSPEDAFDIAVQVAAGLAEAHERGLAHRRLTPESILLLPGGRVKILDFGLAALADPDPGASDASGTHEVSLWRAPEQRRGRPGDVCSDIWALGLLLYRMIAGRLPFRDAEEAPAPLPLLRELDADQARELGRFLDRALAARPEDRFTGMVELRTSLQALVGTGALPRRPPDSSMDASRTRIDGSGSGFRSFPAGAMRDSRLSSSLVGRTVDHYEIRESLGGGGMGVVYKAEDTRLQRTVALKFLPPELTLDPVAKARFLQEARAASALDHPNICTIHEVGETGDGQLFLAMSCYDGETLKRLIERGPLPVDEAIDIAKQIAQGLAKAHRQGIVHRDIKPANIMVTGDGIVKILDFGLAKLAGAAGLTRAGFCLGTPSYMSPEQARGEVDHRTDLWSLGVVLYEMLTGVTPFGGDTDQAIIYSLLTDEPRPLRELRPEAPVDLERVLAGLLAKDPEDRYPTAEAAVADFKVLAGSTMSATIQSLPAVRRRGMPGWVKAALAGAAAVAFLAAGWWLLRPEERLQPTSRPLTDLEGRELYPSLSPGGDILVYVALQGGDQDIFWQRVGGGNPRNLTEDSPAADTQPAFSPDGQQIAFRSERDGGGLFVMGSTGESPRRLTSAGYNPAWSPDSKKIVFATEGVSTPYSRSSTSELWQVDVETAAKRKIFAGDAVQPSWSPDDRRIAFWGLSNGSRRALWTIPADGGGEPVRVSPDDDFFYWNPVWSTDGRWLYFVTNRNGSMNLARVRISPRTGEAEGEIEQITVPASNSGFLSMSRDGRHIAYATNEGRSNFDRVAFDPAAGQVAGPPAQVTEGTRLVRFGEVSPDGRSLVYYTSEPQEDLFLIDAAGGSPRQLTDDIYKDRVPRWSPDGTRIFFFSNRGGKDYEVWSIRPDGSDRKRELSVPGTNLLTPVLRPDGKSLVCGLGFKEVAEFDLTFPPERRRPQPLPGLDHGSFGPETWSPDGAWLTGPAQDEGGSPLTRIVGYSFRTGRYQELVPRGTSPVWLRDSRRLLYIDHGRIHLYDLATRQHREVLAPSPGWSFASVAVSPDNRYLYCLRAQDEGNIYLLTMN